MAKEKANLDEVLRTNQRLNEQIKALTSRNEELQGVIRELENDITELQKEAKGQITSVKKKGITVMYITFDGFKSIQEGDEADDLYDMLDVLHIKFDEIALKHKLERVKSIGDDYACAGGIVEKRSTNPLDICLAALEINDYVQRVKENQEKQGRGYWNIHVGIHSGNGIVESKSNKKKKTSYAITGEVINTVPRISAMSEPGEIYLSDYTYEIVKGYFRCEYSGELPVKYRGNLELYQLLRIKRIYAEDRKTGIVPNAEFILKYHLKEFNDLEEKVIDFLVKNLPEHLHYHDYTHTIDVVNQAELIGYGEGVSDEQILLLKTAALFHDTGHTIESKGHEEHSCTIARKWLKEYEYSQEQIDEICDVIMATQMPPKPKSLLQKIICDSDLDYLGRTDFIPTSNALYKELEASGVSFDINAWNKMQVQFLTGHQFFTATSRRLREVNKQSQIERIKKLIPEE
ncbi:MAG: adenylate/guanylate cyclase domain-containing protein [Crocinitomicaceae bacterium]|nr:HD domain-containing protein [Crocinitomicaceae bacterium]